MVHVFDATREKDMIRHNKPTIGAKEVAATAKVLRSGWLAQGERVAEFEDALCTYVGVPKGHAAAVSNGSAALFLALHALRLKKGAEVIIPTYVCSAVLNAVHMAGATPVLVDIHPDDLNLSLEEVKKKVTRRTGAIVVTHTYGRPVDVTPFLALKVPIVEDCAAALGSRVRGHSVGRQGSIAAFSFYATKMITTGYGGMVVSSDKKLIDRVKNYREFDGQRTYEPRFNFHMSDVEAAIGLEQLRRLPAFLKQRKKIASRYRTALQGKVELWPEVGGDIEPNFYRMLVRVPRAVSLMKFLATKEITTIIPLEKFELLHRYTHQDPKLFPVSEEMSTSLLSLPAYPSLTTKEIDQVCRALQDYFSNI